MKYYWEPYLLIHPIEFNNFWSKYLSECKRNILFIAGLGFDPRTCLGIEGILGENGEGKRNGLLLEYDEDEESPSRQYEDRVQNNRERFISAFEGRGILDVKTVMMWKGYGPSRRRISSRFAQKHVPDIDKLYKYDDVIIDISAMPKSIMFSILGKIITVLQNCQQNDKNSPPNLYAIVTENPDIDKMIEEVGPDDLAEYIPGFGTGLEMEAKAELPKIWIPVLGEGQYESLVRVHNEVRPNEVIPVLPSPAINPRRADDIMMEYRQLLFEEWFVEPQDIIYANERNPFEVYRQILRTADHYKKALKILGGCKIAITAASSKLLSLGAMLATLDLKANGFLTGLAHVEVHGYNLADGIDVTVAKNKSELYVLGLYGDAYHDNDGH